MYSTCIFCGAPLGRNEAVEAFAVGRRLAFDAERGRLWVVCRRCARWNLTPLEERWEAMEQCERLFRDTRRRVSTDNVGLARLADGTELVRVGRALRPELAAWRYGAAFARRRLRNLAVAGAGLAAVGVAVATGVSGGVTVFSAIAIGELVRDYAPRLVRGRPKAVVARLAAPGGPLVVRRWHLSRTSLVPDEQGETALRVTHDGGAELIAGADAERAAARLLPAVNRFAGTREEVAQALDRLDAAGDARRYFAAFARGTGRLTVMDDFRRALLAPMPGDGEIGLNALAPSASLALEMALHEETERRAMEGELAELERAWREAEEIAAIADDLVLPAGVRHALARLRNEGAG